MAYQIPLFNYMYITNNPDVALLAEKNGVNRIWIDLEQLGKEERQKNLDSVKSNHSIHDIKKIAPLLTKSELMVRVNPWNENSVKEIEDVIQAGADIIMLPMWRTLSDVENFLNTVKGKCKTVLLLETIDAQKIIGSVLDKYGDRINEVYIGINDLHIEYKLPHMFQLIENGTVESIINAIKDKGVPYGCGAIGRPGMDLKPSPKELLTEYYRMGCSRVILSRTFCNWEKLGDIKAIDSVFDAGMKYMCEYENDIRKLTANQLVENRKNVLQEIHDFVSKL